MNNRAKILIRIEDKYKHFCYIDKKTLKIFTHYFCSTQKTIGDWVKEWIKEEFGIIVNTAETFEEAKKCIRTKYPSLGNTRTDYHGWLRIWATEKINMEEARSGYK